jgi:starch phosphorylase
MKHQAPSTPPIESQHHAVPRLPMTSDALAADLVRYLLNHLGRDRYAGSNIYRYQAMVYAVRDRITERWRNTRRAYAEGDCRRAYYLSMEYLMGRATQNTVLNLDLEQEAREALHKYGLAWEEVVSEERDAGLGNGGLGRLAACFLDSCATLQLPVMGYGIRYEYGIFRQTIDRGHQHEAPDHWLAYGNPWELERPEHTCRVPFGGRTDFYRDDKGRYRARWADTHDILAVPYDVPIPGYRNGTVNTLRLWKAAPTDEFDLAEFNEGDYADAVASKNFAENISLVLYPNDKSENGKALRLRQQYFLASASLQDVLRRWKTHHESFDTFADKNCFQLNDTHPTIAVPELMRLLMDEHGLGWDESWKIVTRCMAYTNHTLLPEALERWPVSLFRALLPRVLDIIFEINARFLRGVANRWPGDHDRQARMSIIEHGDNPHVRMAHLAIVASFSINGVAALHTELLKAGLFRDFDELWPERFNNKTNGVTQRRWLRACNPELSSLISERIGDGWITDLPQLAKLKGHVDDAVFRARWRAVRHANKARLADLVRRECKVDFPLDAMFDVQVKRIHEYKRQLLKILHVVHLYDRIKRGDAQGWTKRAILIGGKAAPGYAIAKKVIKLANAVADVVNNDQMVGDRLRMVFLPDYNVSKMEIICPGTDLSEQISTAGKEASGTGNMKFMMNGAVTIGTLDGANIEIREEVGDENFFLFGLTAQEVEGLRPTYDPRAIIAGDEDLRRVVDLLRLGHFNPFEYGVFDDILASISDWGDHWMVAADFRAYVDAQERAAAAFQDDERWTRMSILNSATSGKFSTDRTMREYNRDIWRLSPVQPG